MKKSILTFLLCINLILLSACSSTDGKSNDVPINENGSTGDVTNEVKEGESTEEEDTEEGTTEEKKNEIDTTTVTVEEQVLLDKEGVVITLKSLDTEDVWGPGLKVMIENNSDKDITVQTRKSSVNGAMIETLFSSDVAAGKKANDVISFEATDLEIAGITTLKDIEFNFYVMDAESWDPILESDPINITTSADKSFEQTFDDSGFVAVDKEGYKVVLKKLNSEDSFWGSDIYVYIENNSDKNVTVQARDVSVNGFMVEPMFSCDVTAGKVAFDTITFEETDLTNNDIESIEELELSFHIFDMESWDTIYESDIVTASFTEGN